MKKRKSPYELVGQKFGKLIVIEVLPTYRSGKNLKRRVKCKCDCGGEIDTRPELLYSGRSKSCGCISKQRLEEGRNKHGYHLHPLYKKWTGIKQRCYNPNSVEYHNYGGKGVRMCEEWLDNPAKFIEWGINNGWQKGLEIDKDLIARKLGLPALLYSPDLCSFVTPKVNTNNRSITVFIEYKGEKLCISDWAERTGIPRDRIHDRYQNGWPPEKIFDPTDFSIGTRLTGPKPKTKY